MLSNALVSNNSVGRYAVPALSKPRDFSSKMVSGFIATAVLVLKK